MKSTLITRGKDAADSLMRMISHEADKENAECYLECHGEKNKAVYQHLGYEVVEEVEVHDEKLEKQLKKQREKEVKAIKAGKKAATSEGNTKTIDELSAEERQKWEDEHMIRTKFNIMVRKPRPL